MRLREKICLFLGCIFLMSTCFLAISAFAANSVGISLSYDGQMIPSTTNLTGGIINSNGIPVYRVQVKALISGGSNFGGQNVTFVDPNSTTVKLVSVTNPIQMTSTSGPYLGTVTAYYDVRGVTSFTCTATMSGSFIGSGSATITNTSEGYYSASFYITNYWIAYESDYQGGQTATMNISGTNVSVRPSFKTAVNMEGSGRLGIQPISTGSYVQPTWSNGQIVGYHYVTYPNGSLQTCSGTSPIAGKTIAVDKSIIPLVPPSYSIKGCVNVSTYGNRRAEDSGSAITGWHIDVFSGEGSGTSRSNSYQMLRYLGNNLNLW